MKLLYHKKCIAAGVIFAFLFLAGCLYYARPRAVVLEFGKISLQGKFRPFDILII